MIIKTAGKNRQIFKQVFFVFPLIAVILILASGCSTTNHYQNGMDYLSEKKYTEAISEFQKVEAGDKDFRLAQSKISYLQGRMAYNDNLFEAAEVQLVKVISNDEFYHESQLMLDKIRQQRDAAYIPKTDTLIIKDETSGSKGEEREQEKVKVEVQTDADITRKFISEEKEIIEKFESLYQSGYKANVESKKNFLANMQSMASRLNSLSYDAKEKDAEALDLKQKASRWMDKRIEFISRLINDNSTAETNSSRSIKEEGDKLYYAVTLQMKKVK